MVRDIAFDRVEAEASTTRVVISGTIPPHATAENPNSQLSGGGSRLQRWGNATQMNRDREKIKLC